MRAAENLRIAEELLREHATVRRQFMDFAFRLHERRPVPRNAWREYVQYFERANRPSDELAHLHQLQEASDRGEGIAIHDIDELLAALERSSLDLHGYLDRQIAGSENSSHY